jgi:hypothetical protein
LWTIVRHFLQQQEAGASCCVFAKHVSSARRSDSYIFG